MQKIDHPHIHLDVPKFHSRMGTKIHKMNPAKSVLYPFYKEDYMKEINSMKQMHDQPLPFRLPFFGFAYHYIWVSIYQAASNSNKIRCFIENIF